MTKKIISIFTALCIAVCAFSLSSCSNSASTEPTTAKKTAYNTMENVKKSVLQGKIDTVEFALGTKADSILQKYSTTSAQNAQNADHDVFSVTPKADYTRIIKGVAQYFYLNSDADKTISVIASTSDAFNFNVGNCTPNDVIYALGEPNVRDIPDARDVLFGFGFGSENSERLTYNIDKYRLDFIFSNNLLLGVMLTDTSLYKSMGNTVTTAVKTTAATSSATTVAANATAATTKQ